MLNLFKNVINGFSNYLGGNNYKSFGNISSVNSYENHENNVVNFDDLLHKKKTKHDLEDAIVNLNISNNNEDEDNNTDFRDKNKEKSSKGPKLSYVVLIKRQRLIKSLNKVTKAFGVEISPRKKRKHKRILLNKLHYKMGMIELKLKILKNAEKRFGKLNISKSTVYLEEDVGVFLDRVRRGINDECGWRRGK